MTRIILQDFRHPTTRICPKARFWFDSVGLDWNDFKRNGATADELRRPGQHLDAIDRLEKVALAREARDGRR